MDIQSLLGFFVKLDRSIFIDNENKEMAFLDEALQIGHGQTISQPSLVLEMTYQLGIDKSLSVLEIGTGSGYQTALLAEFSGKVYTIEKIPELAHRARERLEALGYKNILYKIGDGSEGWQEYAPFDRIIATAAVGKMPVKLIAQLKEGGRIIIPSGPQGLQDLLLVQKDEHGNIVSKSLGKVRFVEFKGEYGWNNQ